MADHMYKPSEVPKGQRWQHFLDYYKIPFIATVCGIIAVISILKSTVFSPKPDVSILAVGGAFVSYEQWDAATAAMADMPLDYNEDGRSLVEIDSIPIDESTQKSDPEVYVAYQTKLMASLAAADCALQIVDENMYAYFDEQGLVGTYSELPDTLGHNADESIKIPLKQLAPFNTMTELPDGLYMTLRPRDAMQLGHNKKKLAAFENQVDALMTMLKP